MPIGFTRKSDGNERPVVELPEELVQTLQGSTAGKEILTQARKEILKPEPDRLDVTVCTNLNAVVQTFRLNTSEVALHFEEAVASIRSWRNPEEVSDAEGALARVQAVAKRIELLGEFATEVLRDERAPFGDNSRRPPGPEDESPEGYIPDISNRARYLVADLGRKADRFWSHVEAFALDLESFAEWALNKDLRQPDVPLIQRQALGVQAEMNSFLRDTLAVDGPEGAGSIIESPPATT